MEDVDMRNRVHASWYLMFPVHALSPISVSDFNVVASMLECPLAFRVSASAGCHKAVDLWADFGVSNGAGRWQMLAKPSTVIGLRPDLRDQHGGYRQDWRARAVV